MVAGLGVKKAANYPASKLSFNPKRKEQVDQAMIAESFRRQFSKYKPPEETDPEQAGILIREIKAHRDNIVQMAQIKGGVRGLITVSLDMLVRLWSPSLDLWGTINSLTEQQDPKWCLPQKFRQESRKRDVAKMKEVLKDLGSEDASKTHIRITEVDSEEDETGHETGIKWKTGPSEAVQTKLKDEETSFYLGTRHNKRGQKIEKMLARMEKIQDFKAQEYQGFAKELSLQLDYHQKVNLERAVLMDEEFARTESTQKLSKQSSVLKKGRPSKVT